jgi:hypothetical protein
MARCIEQLDTYADTIYIPYPLKLVPERLEQARLEFLSENPDPPKSFRWLCVYAKTSCNHRHAQKKNESSAGLHGYAKTKIELVTEIRR